MFKKSFYADQRLEIVILGAMRGSNASSSERIRQAVSEVLDEDRATAILFNKGIIGKPNITYPEKWQEHQIEDGVFDKLDTADLIIVNITPKAGKSDPTPNVFYELGLIHALGIPYIILIQEGHSVPFYMRNTRNYRVRNFGVKTLKKVLSPPIYAFIDEKEPLSFTENIISRFYNGLPIVDISASVGLATGYYMNFARRILKDDGFVSFYPEKIKKLIIVRPYDIFNTYLQDIEHLSNILKKHSITLETQKLDPVNTDKNGPLWFDHYKGIIIDIPRAIYPLKKSPRILSLKKRLHHSKTQISEEIRTAMLKQAANRLLDKVEDVIRFHITMDEENIRETMLYFSTIEELPSLLSTLEN